MFEGLRLAAELPEGQSRVQFRATVESVPDSLLGRELVLAIGTSTVMGLPLPAAAPAAPLQFGPTYLSMEELKGLASYDVTLRLADDEERFPVPREITDGPLFEAIGIQEEAEFLAKVQLHHSRFRNRDLVYLGAKATYLRLNGPLLQAAALTVLAHRYLERDLLGLSPVDRRMMRWIDGEARKVTSVLAAELDAITGATPPFPLVRWTVSLATVGGMLALCRDELPTARQFFAIAARQMPHVRVSAVSGLNLVNACFIAGLLAAVAGDQEEARELLRTGVTSYPQIAAAQNMMANVWVIGDLIDVAHSARQCFIALVWLGLAPESREPVVDALTTLEPKLVKSKLAAIIASGFAPRLAAAFAEIAQNRKVP